MTDAEDVRFDELLKERDALQAALERLQAEMLIMTAELERLERDANESAKRNLALAEKMAYLANLRALGDR